jgi:hypothetical protein
MGSTGPEGGTCQFGDAAMPAVQAWRGLGWSCAWERHFCMQMQRTVAALQWKPISAVSIGCPCRRKLYCDEPSSPHLN